MTTNVWVEQVRFLHPNGKLHPASWENTIVVKRAFESFLRVANVLNKSFEIILSQCDAVTNDKRYARALGSRDDEKIYTMIFIAPSELIPRNNPNAVSLLPLGYFFSFREEAFA